MGPREIRRSRPLRAVETVACRRPAALRTPGAAETGEQPEPPAEGGSSAGGTEGGEGLTVSELPDWLNPTGLEPAA